MKFMVMHKHDQQTEAGQLPPPEFIAQMGGFIGQAAQSGKLLDGEGLGATRTRSRITFKDGKQTTLHGPFTGSNELPSGFAKVVVKSRQEALDLASTIGKAIGEDVEIEVSKLTEAWDLGFGEKPADAPERFLIIHKATPASEAGRAPKLTQLMQELTAKGLVTASAVLAPSSQAKRLTWRGGQHRVLDGPFTESKELLGGYALLELPSLEECLTFTREYADLMLTAGDTLEIDIRPL